MIETRPAVRVGNADMRLADFILANRSAILAEWSAFAKTCTPASGSMGIDALSDHASEMLTVIAEDLKTPQDVSEQSAKAKGLAPKPPAGERTAAEKHGKGRAESGFTLDQMVAEYRALRASVIRLWSKQRSQATSEDLVDLTRFNEAIDQSLAESITRFTQDLDKSKEMFLAILGHDLRSPIGAVLTSAKFMLDTNELEEPHLTLTTRILSATTRMNNMVGALLDFTRSRLGQGIPITPAVMNMGKLVHDVVNEVLAANPDRTIDVDARGALTGKWDAERMTQVLTNLLGNALEHGSPRGDVTVNVQGTDDEVKISVHNRGVAIPEDELDGIFNAMKHQSSMAKSNQPTANLGLGLYIADRIVEAHHGSIEVESSDEKGTTFTIHLPRQS